ncbi:MAG TPA: hypothetical protein VEP90_06835, partial [Methylomirabilota bacterium]|nr:hypothetical protein [Methylomirabilota bacterium]
SLSHMVSFLLASRLLKKIIVRELRPRRVRLYETLPKRDRYDFMRLDTLLSDPLAPFLYEMLEVMARYWNNLPAFLQV